MSWWIAICWLVCNPVSIELVSTRGYALYEFNNTLHLHVFWLWRLCKPRCDQTGLCARVRAYMFSSIVISDCPPKKRQVTSFMWNTLYPCDRCLCGGSSDHQVWFALFEIGWEIRIWHFEIFAKCLAHTERAHKRPSFKVRNSLPKQWPSSTRRHRPYLKDCAFSRAYPYQTLRSVNLKKQWSIWRIPVVNQPPIRTVPLPVF